MAISLNSLQGLEHIDASLHTFVLLMNSSFISAISSRGGFSGSLRLSFLFKLKNFQIHDYIVGKTASTCDSDMTRARSKTHWLSLNFSINFDLVWVVLGAAEHFLEAVGSFPEHKDDNERNEVIWLKKVQVRMTSHIFLTSPNNKMEEKKKTHTIRTVSKSDHKIIETEENRNSLYTYTSPA